MLGIGRVNLRLLMSIIDLAGWLGSQALGMGHFLPPRGMHRVVRAMCAALLPPITSLI
jgi:hypothetical protein